MARILTTVVGSYPLPDWLARAPSEQALVDATRVVIATQERAGIDLVCDGELYRFDVNHPETNGMMRAPDGRGALGHRLLRVARLLKRRRNALSHAAAGRGRRRHRIGHPESEA